MIPIPYFCLVASVIALSGCGREWIIPSSELSKLHGYPLGSEIELVDRKGEVVIIVLGGAVVLFLAMG